MTTPSMPPPRQHTVEDNRIWAAGFICALGTFTLHEGRPLLIVKSSRDMDSVRRFAETIHANANRCMINGKPGLRVTVSGHRLYLVMKALWPELTRTRKLDYLHIRARAKEWQSRSTVEDHLQQAA